MSGLEGVLESLAGSIQTSKDKERVGAGTWVGGLVAGVLVIIVVAIYSFIAWQKGKEMAKLRHEQVMREEQIHTEAINAELAERQAEKEVALAKVSELGLELADLVVREEEVKREHAEAIRSITSITSWDKFDAFLESRSIR